MILPFKQTPYNSLFISLIVISIVPLIARGSGLGSAIGGFILGVWAGRLVRFTFELQAKIDRLTEENELLGEAIYDQHLMTERTPRPHDR